MQIEPQQIGTKFKTRTNVEMPKPIFEWVNNTWSAIGRDCILTLEALGFSNNWDRRVQF